MEAQDFSRFIHPRGNLGDTIFLLADQCHPLYYGYPHKKQTYVFRSRGNPLSRALAKRFPALDHEVVKTGGSVATAAFYLAARAGCDPIVLVGQDLALDSGTWYAGAENEDKVIDARRLVPGYFGGEVATNDSFRTNIEWYRQAAAAMKRHKPELRLINATEGGADLTGFEKMRFGEVAFRYLGKPIVIEPPESGAHRDPGEAALATFRAELEGFATGAGKVLREFTARERCLLSELARGRAVPDPTDEVTAFLDCFAGKPFLNELLTIEHRVALGLRKRLPTKDENMRARIWASLAMVLDGSSQLIESFPWGNGPPKPMRNRDG